MSRQAGKRMMWLVAVLPWAPGRTMGDSAGPSEPQAAVEPATVSVTEQDKLALLQSDPQAFLRLCLQQGPPHLRDFRCVFLQNERVDGKLTGEQVIEIAYRREPRSVRMKWIRNANGAKRLVWVRGRHQAADGREEVLVEPSGLAGVFVSSIWLPMNDPRLLRKSRRPVRDFGPDATLKNIVDETEAAARAGALKLWYRGEGVVDGRRTYVLLRHLPEAAAAAHSDARLVLHIDQQWLIPLRIHSYADHQEDTLLESYEFTQIQANLGLADKDFDL